MRIRESACESNIKISKFKFNCDECDKTIPKPLPQNLGGPSPSTGGTAWSSCCWGATGRGWKTCRSTRSSAPSGGRPGHSLG